MDEIWGIFAANPWLWPLLAVGLVVWVSAIVVIFRSKKFLRKWLWVLLAFFSFSFTWETEPGTSIGIGFPVGALYVLGFWLFGPWPTAEEIARREELRRVNGANVAAPGWRLTAIRAGYAIAAFGALALAVLSGSGVIAGAILAGSNAGPMLPLGLSVVMTACFVAIGGLLVLLTFRPYWWGKLMCVWTGLSWIGFSVMSVIIMPGNLAVSLTALVAGFAQLLAALIHQIADPRFSGPYLRRA